MRYVLVSAEEPTVEKHIDIPDRIIKKKISKRKPKRVNKKPSKNKKKVERTIKPTQSSKSVIRKNGAIHRGNK